MSINGLYIEASCGFRDPSWSPGVTSRLKVPVISHTLETPLLHREVAAEPSLATPPPNPTLSSERSASRQHILQR